MKVKKTSLILIVVLLAMTMFAGTVGASPLSSAEVASSGTPGSQATAVYIIKFAEPAVASYTGGVAGLEASSPQATGERKLDVNSPASTAYHNYLSAKHDAFVSSMEALLGRSVDVKFQYIYAYNGMAVELTGAEAARVAGMPNVVNIQAEKFYEPVTDVGPTWIGAPEIWNGNTTGGVDTMGEGVIIGVLDTGINSTHPSFADIGGDGFNHTNPWGSGVYVGVCDPGDPSYQPGFTCNDKLIGAWTFVSEPTTPEDSDGHGSHTASTAGGNVVTSTLVAPTTSISATISGVAPHANIVAYDVCVASCPGSALIAAANQAIVDGVDVINYSISGSDSPWTDPQELAFLDDFNAGIFVSASFGNNGPGASTGAHSSPWVMSVGASTHNRLLSETLENMTGGATTPPADISGGGFTSGYGPASIVYAGDYPSGSTATPELCGVGSLGSFISPWPPGTFTGQIVVCDRGTFGRVEKGANALFSGAGGYVLADNGGGIVSDPHELPGIHISQADGTVLKTWLASGSGHMAEISGTTADYSASNGDIMAGFSSRGPSQYDILVPSVTGPGVSIWAAVCNGCASASPDYDFISGTSMSSPHDAGAAALMVALHPTWSPDEIKSAMMMSAYNGSSVRKEDGTTPADPFDMGSGSLRMGNAANAGIVLEESGADFLAADPNNGGDPKTLNIASMADNNCGGNCVFTRTVTSVYPVTVTWSASLSLPAGVTGSVTPNNFDLGPGDSQELVIDLDASGAATGVWLFGDLDLTPTVTAAPVSAPPRGSVAIGDAPGSFATNANSDGQSVVATRPEIAAGGSISITQSTDNMTISPGTVACSPDSGATTTDNQFLRAFDLDSFGLTSGFNVTDVEFGIEALNTAAMNITVNLYQWDGVSSFTYGNFSLIGTTTQNLAPQTTTLVTFPVTGNAPAGSYLVVEIAAPDTSFVSAFFAGSNAAGQSAASYLASTSCSVPNPLSFATIGFPNVHLVMTVWGDEPVVGAGPSAAHMPIALQVAPADIDVDPSSLSSTQAPNTVTMDSFDISNNGTNPLTWTITEDEDTPTAGPSWSDNFDSYATGSSMHGQGGWKGWDNSAGATANTSSAQAASAPNSVDINGGADLVHEYSGYTSGVWEYVAWQYIPTGFSGTSYFILNSEYNDGGPYKWSVQVHFSSATGLVVNEGNSGGSTPIQYDEWVEIKVVIDLDNDLQFFYYDGALLYQGTWTAEQAGGGQLELQAVDLYANSASSVFYDDLSLSSAAGICTVVDDIPWASVSPTAGTTSPSGTDQVDVTFDSTGLSEGTYTGNLCISSNDPDESLVVFPLELNVSAGATTIYLPIMFNDYSTGGGGGTPVSITHSTDDSTVASGLTVACSGDGGISTTDNQFLREFDLDSFGLTSGFNVTDVEFGIEALNTANMNITVNLYQWDGVSSFTYGNFSLIGTTTQNLAPQTQTLVSFPVAGNAAAGSVLVVEIAAPDTTGVSGFFAGANSNGETAPSYLASTSCGLPNPLTFSGIGFPGIHLVMTVSGLDPALNASGTVTLGGGVPYTGSANPAACLASSTGLTGFCRSSD